MATVQDFPARTASRPRVPDAALPWLGVLGVLVLVELAVRVGLISSRYFPTVTDMASALFDQLGQSAYWAAIAHTLEGWVIGLASAIAIAVPVGLLLGFNEVLHHAFRPAIEFLRPVPSVA